MKMRFKAALAAALALMLALASLPVSALPKSVKPAVKDETAPCWIVPDGYNAHDYDQCVQFLEQTDENGVKNGTRCSNSYNPNDPGTWGHNSWNDYGNCFRWTTVNGEQRIYKITIPHTNVVGSLDASDFSELVTLDCSSSRLTEVNISGCTSLNTFTTYNNSLTEILSVDSSLSFNRLYSDGSGYIACNKQGSTTTFYAYPVNGATFDGFCDENGAVISYGEGSTSITFSGELTGTVVARFTNSQDYNENDYSKLRSFLEQTDESGVKNGAKFSSDYDPNTPSTWGTAFRWINVNGERRILSINPGWLNGGSGSPCGELDLSGCIALETLRIQKYFYSEPYINITAVDVTGCIALKELTVRNARLEELDVSTNTALTALQCGGNMLTELDVSNNSELVMLACWHNALTSLDVSNNILLEKLYCDFNELTCLDVTPLASLTVLQCSNNMITELNISNNRIHNLCCINNLLTEIDLNTLFSNHTVLRAEGSGTVGFENSEEVHSLGAFYANPNDGAEFIRFEIYTKSGQLLEDAAGDDFPFDEGYPESNYLSSQAYWYWLENYYYGHNLPEDFEEITIVARFSSVSLPADADGNGVIDTTDALYVLRCALGISGDPEDFMPHCDIDDNGVIDTTDALLVLRLALNIG